MIRSVYGRFVPLATLVGLSSACAVDAFLLDVGLLPGTRENAVAQCCSCLASAAPDVANLPEEVSTCADIPPHDGGDEADCLCGLPQSTCQTQLLAGQRVSVWGSCTDVNGACASQCESVLAYPE